MALTARADGLADVFDISNFCGGAGGQLPGKAAPAALAKMAVAA